MDIKKQSKGKSILSSKRLAIVGAIFVTISLVLVTITNKDSVSHKDILISKVMQGDLEQIVRGDGNLRSEFIRVISAPSNSVVSEVILKPGEEVNSGDVIAKLENLLIEQELENAQWELSQAKASFRKTAVNNKMSLLELMDEVARAKSDLTVAKMEFEATKEIMVKGIVSKIDFKKLQEQVKQHQSNLKFLENKKDILAEAHDELLNIANDEVIQKENELKSIQNRFDRLTIRANSSGVIQSMDIEPGQSLLLGQKIALIGSDEQLISIVRVPQNEVTKISIGNVVKMSNGRDQFYGEVARIAPVVTENSVEVEVHFAQELPQSIRPKQRVDATIVTGTLNNVTYITRPSTSRENSTLSLFKLNSEGDLAELTPFRLGQIAGNKIVINGDVKTGDEVIVSDLTKLTKRNSKIITIY